MNQKAKNLTIVGIVVIALLLIGTTYAFFSAQGGLSTSRDVSVTSNTTDNLSFSISNDISFTVTQTDFQENGSNKSGNATVTAILTPNNKTGEATGSYYLYLNLTENGIIYSSTNTTNQPELMVQVFNGNNELVSLTGLGAQKIVKGVTGYDITGRLGLIPLLDNREISASNNTTETETWHVVVTVINLNVDQQDNTNKTVAGELIIRKDEQLDSPRLAVTIPQKASGVTKGYADTVIESEIVNDEEIYTIYTVGYITDDTISGTTYSIDIKNLGINLSKYELELVGTPEVMTTENDYTNYVTMKNEGVPLTSLSNGNTNSAEATATDFYTYSLNASELTINDVIVSCDRTMCTATINESFSNISGKNKHNTTNSNNEAINVLYNGIKFNLKKTIRDDNITQLAEQYNLSEPGVITLENGYIYYHDENLANSAHDFSYRYAGANPNNYLCFGSTDTECPAENLYRIIGLIPVDVIIDDTDPSNLITERKTLYKIIRNDYETETTLGRTKLSQNVRTWSYDNLNGDPPSGLHAFGWAVPNNRNTWSLSPLNTAGLNTKILNDFGAYANVIEKVAWSVGGNTYSKTLSSNSMTTNFENEVLYPELGSYSDDGLLKYSAKIGLMYATDYGYAAPQTAWTVPLGVYSQADYRRAEIKTNNWMFRGVAEWTITRNTTDYIYCYRIDCFGDIDIYTCNSFNHYDGGAAGLRRVFYLKENVQIDMTNYAGTKTDPYRIL